MNEKKLLRFLDDQGRLKQLPARRRVREEVFAYLSSKFQPGVDYLEREVNAILTQWSTIDDYFVLRRGLVDTGLLLRTPDGGRYWLNPARE